ncbi:helix-turn-helix domain-containing protein [Siccibacter colletis]|uniref:helix-turn-helix domain-containing protein n=1 Tax=Siccibacter colletis TaxID=1505757 RepID=UPI0004E25FD6|nr:helix-turn-helix transcriptional regulator [Siccibacter colletis]
MGRTLEQMLADEKPEVVAAAQAEANEMLLEVNLAMLRDRVRKTQMEMAQALGVKQPTIAGIEKAGRDLKLSTLKRYVEALGGKVRLDIKLPDGTRYDFTL